MTACRSEELIRRLEARGADAGGAARDFAREVGTIAGDAGIQAAYNCVMRAQAALGFRKPSLAIYDHAFHMIGGAQKYGLTMVAALRDFFDITILANKEARPENFRDWYDLDLSACALKVIALPFYEERSAFHIDPAFITRKIPNPFHLVSLESGNYDVFVNNSMNEMVYPLSNVSVLICHFPERRRRSYFYADRYTHTITNSRYTAAWVESRWKYRPQLQIYPPVDMDAEGGETPKKKIILSVARFEPEGTKRQLEMVQAFRRLGREWPEILRGWRLVLAGGSSPDNCYLAELERLGAGRPEANIELRVNIPLAELKSLYRESTLFWHLCGLTHDDPSEIEHFGMTTVEAMQNRLVPLVYDGGGLPEIVDHGVNGFRVKSKAELLDCSIRLLQDPHLVRRLGEAAAEKSRMYTRARFEARVRAFFGEVLEDYTLGKFRTPDRTTT
jgi:glycosyltransferase involved in cell wall biosynthesis